MIELGIALNTGFFIINCMSAGLALSQERYGAAAFSAGVGLFNIFMANRLKDYKASKETKE